MLYKLKFVFDIKKTKRIDYDISSKLHGVLMEFLDYNYAAKLHEDGLKPYSQNIELKGDILEWYIYALTEESYENIILKLYDQEMFFIKSLNIELVPIKSKLEKISLEEIFNDNFTVDSDRVVRVKFKTVTAFKSDGKYINFPDIRLILQSLITKYDLFMKDKIFDYETLNQLLNNINISSYNIRSARFKVDNTYIPGFIGYMNFYIKGPQQLVNLFNYLMDFAQYSGVGIKTSLGMGKIEKGKDNAREE